MKEILVIRYIQISLRSLLEQEVVFTAEVTLLSPPPPTLGWGAIPSASLVLPTCRSQKKSKIESS